MLRKTSLVLLLALPFLVLSACKGFNDIGFTGVDGFVLKGMENNTLTFAANVNIKNPSSMGFKVSEINLKTTVDGNFIGTLTADKMVRIPARSDSSYRMDFSLELASLLTGASNLYSMARKKQVTVEMLGFVKARSLLVGRKIDVKEKQVIDVPSFNR